MWKEKRMLFRGSHQGDSHVACCALWVDLQACLRKGLNEETSRVKSSGKQINSLCRGLSKEMGNNLNNTGMIS